MIATAVQQGSIIRVYNEKNSCIFTRSGILVGYTSNTVSVKEGSIIRVYNDKNSCIQTHSAR